MEAAAGEQPVTTEQEATSVVASGATSEDALAVPVPASKDGSVGVDAIALDAAVQLSQELLAADPAPEISAEKDTSMPEAIQESLASVMADHQGAVKEENPSEDDGSENKESSPEASDITENVPKAENATNPDTEEDQGAKGKGSPAKAKRKEDKSIEHVLKALSSLETTEEKLAALCKKYTDLLEDHRQVQNKFKQTQRRVALISREKDQLQSDHSKAVLAKSKLESLCRELQRHNKLVKEESLARAKEEEEKRKEVTNKFQTTIGDIQKQMNENYEKNNKLREENIELASKLKNLIEQYELREQHIEKVFKHKELEQQLVDAKLAQACLQMSQEQEKSLKEKEVLLHEASDAQKKIGLMEAQEQQLRAQVALYTDKYEEFQQTLAKSNEVFGSFKTEMDKMTKKIKKLEKETVMWKTRWENSNKALLQMAEEKTRSDKETAVLQTKVQKLESLCRALQLERKKTTPAAGSTAPEAASSVTVNGASESKPSDKSDIEPTKTPPNTPENAGSRASPVTVQSEGDSDQTEQQLDKPAEDLPTEEAADSVSQTDTADCPGSSDNTDSNKEENKTSDQTDANSCQEEDIEK